MSSSVQTPEATPARSTPVHPLMTIMLKMKKDAAQYEQRLTSLGLEVSGWTSTLEKANRTLMHMKLLALCLLFALLATFLFLSLSAVATGCIATGRSTMLSIEPLGKSTPPGSSYYVPNWVFKQTPR